MEVLGQGSKPELRPKLQLRQRWILNPLPEAGNRTCVPTLQRCGPSCCASAGTPQTLSLQLWHMEAPKPNPNPPGFCYCLEPGHWTTDCHKRMSLLPPAWGSEDVPRSPLAPSESAQINHPQARGRSALTGTRATLSGLTSEKAVLTSDSNGPSRGELPGAPTEPHL